MAIPRPPPSEQYTVTVKTTVEVDPPGQQSRCPIQIDAKIDFTQAVVESNEENNTDTASCP